MPGLHPWFADLSANFAGAQIREIPQPLSYDLSTGAVATLRVMPSYSAFSLRLTLRAIRGSTPLTARSDQPIIALRALFGLYCSSPLSVRLATDLGCLSLGTGHVFCFIRQKPFREGGHSATLYSQDQARVRWFQGLLGSKIPRLVVFRLPATRLSDRSRTRKKMVSSCLRFQTSCHPPLPASSDLMTTLQTRHGCLGLRRSSTTTWTVRMT